MDDLLQLIEILQEVGPGKIWRPVYAPGNRLLADGIGDLCDGLPQDLAKINFKGKTVADIGCNFGYYTFIVKRAGAAHVTGIDIDRRIIRGCKLLQDIHRIDGVSFVAKDIVNSNRIGPFDIGMMIDFIGKTTVTCGLFKAYLNALERLSQKEMIVSIRPVYNVKKHLNNDYKGLREKYPGRYIRNDLFLTLDYICDRFDKRWHLASLSSKKVTQSTEKETFHFFRKTT